MARYISGETRLTGILVLAIVFLLIAVHFLLPQKIQQQLVFDHSRFAIYTLWTSAYVHLDDAHLFGNLGGFLIAMSFLWVLFAHRERQQLLRRTLIGFLLIFPLLGSLSDYMIFQYYFGAEDAATRGFSGIIAGLFGLLLVSIVELVWNRTGVKEAGGVAFGLILSTMLMMLVYGGAATNTTLLIGGFGILLSLTLALPWPEIKDPRLILEEARENAYEVGLVGSLSIYLVLILPFLFPLSWASGDSITNIYGHFSGLMLGAIYGSFLALILSERGQIELRKRQHFPRIYLSNSLINIFRYKTLLTIIAPVFLGAIGYLFSPQSPVLAGATVLYASLLLLREIPDQVALKIDSSGFHDSREREGAFSVVTTVENVGNEIAKDVVVYCEFYDPITDTRSWSTKGKSEYRKRDNTVDIDPSHQEKFEATLSKNWLPDDDFPDDGRIEIRVEARNQHFSTRGYMEKDELEKSRAFVEAIRGMADSYTEEESVE